MRNRVTTCPGPGCVPNSSMGSCNALINCCRLRSSALKAALKAWRRLSLGVGSPSIPGSPRLQQRLAKRGCTYTQSPVFGACRITRLVTNAENYLAFRRNWDAFTGQLARCPRRPRGPRDACRPRPSRPLASISRASANHAASSRRVQSRLMRRGMPPRGRTRAGTPRRGWPAGPPSHARQPMFDVGARLSGIKGPRWQEAMMRWLICPSRWSAACGGARAADEKLCTRACESSWKLDSMRNSSSSRAPRFCASSTISSARFPWAASDVKQPSSAANMCAWTGPKPPRRTPCRSRTAAPRCRAACCAPAQPRPRFELSPSITCDQRRLARPDLSGDDDEALALEHAVLQVGERSRMALAREEETRVGVEREGRGRETEMRLEHGRLRSGGSTHESERRIEGLQVDARRREVIALDRQREVAAWRQAPGATRARSNTLLRWPAFAPRPSIRDRSAISPADLRAETMVELHGQAALACVRSDVADGRQRNASRFKAFVVTP